MKNTSHIIQGLISLLSDSSYRIAENYDGSQNRTSKVVLIDIDSLEKTHYDLNSYEINFSVKGIIDAESDKSKAEIHELLEKLMTKLNNINDTNFSSASTCEVENFQVENIVFQSDGKDNLVTINCYCAVNHLFEEE